MSLWSECLCTICSLFFIVSCLYVVQLELHFLSFTSNLWQLSCFWDIQNSDDVVQSRVMYVRMRNSCRWLVTGESVVCREIQRRTNAAGEGTAQPTQQYKEWVQRYYTNYQQSRSDKIFTEMQPVMVEDDTVNLHYIINMSWMQKICISVAVSYL